MTSIAVGNRRLLRLAKILDTADALHRKRKEPTYYQLAYVHECGTPACAWGHYSAATPRLKNWDTEKRNVIHSHGEISQNEFAMSEEESWDMFNSFGCDYAKTAKQAAKYIRAFVANRKQRT